MYIDGTFKTCPPPYTQFVTLHGRYMGRPVPLIYCLLGGKTIGHYREFLGHVSAETRRISGRRFRPRVVICDFEPALITALQTELPAVSVRVAIFILRKVYGEKFRT